MKDASVELVTLSGNLAEFFTMGASDASAVRAMREWHFETGNATERTAAFIMTRQQLLATMDSGTAATGDATLATLEDAAAMSKAAAQAKKYDDALKELNFTLFGEARSDLNDRFDKVEDAFVRRLDQIQAVTDAAEEAQQRKRRPCGRSTCNANLSTRQNYAASATSTKHAGKCD